VTFEDFRPWHLEAIDPLGLPQTYAGFIGNGYGAELARRGPAYTARAGGRILLCGGIAFDDSREAWLWSFVSAHARAHFMRLHRHTQRFLEVHAVPLTATADQGGTGCRWLELLGFERTQELRGFFPGCPDQFVYRRP
jgi:hypothetical protein